MNVRARRGRLLCAAVAVAVLVAAAHAHSSTSNRTDTMNETTTSSRILVHITHGPEHPTRAALGFAVARAAVQQGHLVTVFLAGDAVQLMREDVLNQLVGLGTGDLRELYDGIVAGGGRFYVSGGSSRARGLAEDDTAGKGVQFAGPEQLVRLALEHDRMFNY